MDYKYRFKFRVWNKTTKRFFSAKSAILVITNFMRHPDDTRFLDYVIEQCTGLKDKCDKSLFFCGDIGEFDNGDRFVIKTEDWNELYVDWIGNPECEDQARDFYRIRNATIVGNIHENPELLEANSGL